MINYNIANIESDNDFVLPNTYKISEVTFQNEPYDNIPENCTLTAWDDFLFGLEITNEFISCENAVIDEDGKPIYLIGVFKR